MDFTQIKESCLYVHDLDRSQEFYEKLLGLPLISRVPDRHVFFRVGPSVLLCFLASATKAETVLPPHFAEGKQHIAFEVEIKDYEQVKATLVAKGITVTHRQIWKGTLESFYFEDPDGHVLEIVPTGLWE